MKFYIYLIFMLMLFSILCFPYKAESQLEYNPKVDKEVYNLLTEHDYVSVMVVLNKDKQAEVLSGLSLNDFVPIYRYKIIDGFFGKVSKNGLEKLENDNLVSNIHRPSIYIPLLNESLSIINATFVNEIQHLSINISGRGETICIIDSGINNSHPAFANKILKEKCFCNDNGVPCCPNNQYEDDNATDENGHGTHVSAIAAANGSVKGVAPDSNIVAIRIVNPESEEFSEADLIAAIDFCVDNKSVYNISVISLSLGTVNTLYENSEECDQRSDAEAVNNASNQGLFVSIASGNNGNYKAMSAPACASNVTSVGATYDSFSSLGDIDDIRNSTNRNAELDLLSPGCQIKTLNFAGGLLSGCETSSAAPHVAGTAALLKQYEKLKNNRTVTPAEITSRFKETGKLIFDNETNLTFPRIDVYAALFPIDVTNLQQIKTTYDMNVFRFEIKNNYNNATKNINWSFDVGIGNATINTESISLPPLNTTFVYFEHNFTDGDIYDIEASASSGDINDSETMTLAIGDIIAYDLKEIYKNGKERMFRFKILNNMNESKSVNWTMYLQEQTITANNLTMLQPGEETFVHFHYNYTTGGDYTVLARAFNESNSDQTRGIEITVPD